MWCPLLFSFFDTKSSSCWKHSFWVFFWDFSLYVLGKTVRKLVIFMVIFLVVCNFYGNFYGSRNHRKIYREWCQGILCVSKTKPRNIMRKRESKIQSICATDGTLGTNVFLISNEKSFFIKFKTNCRNSLQAHPREVGRQHHSFHAYLKNQKSYKQTTDAFGDDHENSVEI